MTQPALPQGGSWARRRRFMYAVTLFCMAVIFYCVAFAEDTAVTQTALFGSFMVLGGIVGSYVFGATWEDISIARLRK